MKINSSAAVLPVSDLDASLRYFIDVLGFAEDFRFEQYAGIKRDDCCIHLSAHDKPGSGKVYIFCDDVDGYFADITKQGASTDDEPKDYAYGMRDFITRDPDGNQLTFGAPTKDP
ncbi:MAG: VOC family protein [Phycisphaeraceae bacterium JB051]